MSDKVAVIGAGAWGTAFAAHLVRCGHDVSIWCRDGCLGARERTDLPDKDGLLFAKPNPFNSTVSIEYQVAHAAEIDIDAFDMSGRKIASIMHGFVKQGRHETRWEPTALPSGIYNIRLRIDGAEYVNKVTYIK